MTVVALVPAKDRADSIGDTVRALIATVASGDVHDMLLRLLGTVVAPINMKTGAIEMRKAGRQAQAIEPFHLLRDTRRKSIPTGGRANNVLLQVGTRLSSEPNF